MTTQTITGDQQFELALQVTNIASRHSIQSAVPSAIKITGDYTQTFQSVMACVEGGAANKGNLIELLFHFQQAGDYCRCDPDDYWIAEIVSSDSWSQQVNERYWSHYWDGDFDSLGSTINACYNEFFPLQ